MEKKNNKYFIIIFLTVLSLIQLRSYLINNCLKKSKKFTIAKFTLKKRLPKKTNFYFTYIINGEKIVTANSGIDYDILNFEAETKIIDNLKINCFYLAKYDPKHPNVIIVDPLKRVIDTIEILKAGFSREDIKN